MPLFQSRLALLCLLTLALTVAAPAASAKIRVEVTQDAEAPYGDYGLYRWKELPKLPAAAPSRAPILEARLQAAVEKGLQNRGFQKATEDQEADFLVLIFGAIEDRLDLSGVDYELSPRVHWADDESLRFQRSYKEGTLVIDILDAASGELVWSGAAHDASDKPEKLVERIEKAVAKILRKFPPK
ncbi:MAG: DUF4136 domain-containing protein [Acidobacteriota bacterium]|nr:DUF4136 domain-containing protein [Acidobacteriota bacterium]